MPTAHLIHGYLGAGKTSFARQLEQTLPAIRFTHDEWMARLFGEDSPAARFAEYHQRVSAQIDTVWPRCLELGLEVVLDLAFWSRRHRDETRQSIAAIGAECRLYRLVCSEDVAWRRIEQRNRNLGGSLLIVRNTFDMLKARFEPLAPDESCVDIASD